ncbi:hypothetical protein INR49_031203 [Caranx melampygus]|nr:hypothetical protein INR49_031203 [Caranx melampygus]
MEFVKILLYLVICQSSGIITAADDHLGHSAENVHWVSLDFKTIITWTSKGSDQTFSVQFAEVDDEIWRESLDCTQVSYTQCDLSNDLRASDSAATFTVEALDDGRVRVNITDPLTALHNKERQLNIRDVFKKDLKYKIGYYKSGNTRKASTAGSTQTHTSTQRDFISDSSVAEVPNLDAGESYCFMVAAYIPSRPRDNQLGAWSKEPRCTDVYRPPSQELSLGVWVGIAFILLTVLIIIIIVTVLCCKIRRPSVQRFQVISYIWTTNVSSSPKH